MEDSAQARITANTTTPSATTRPLHVKIVGLQNRPSYNGLTAAARPSANPNDGRPGFSVIIDGTFEKKWLKECYIEVIDATIDPNVPCGDARLPYRVRPACEFPCCITSSRFLRKPQRVEASEAGERKRKHDDAAAPACDTPMLLGGAGSSSDDPFLAAPPPPAPSHMFDKNPLHSDKLTRPGVNYWSKIGPASARTRAYVAEATDWKESDDLRGFVAMEKYDGIRAEWQPLSPDGPQFMGRSGKWINPPPKSFAALLPTDLALDGELWAGRGNFELCGALMGGSHPAKWKHLRYMVFDAPRLEGKTYSERLQVARMAISRIEGAAAFVEVVSPVPCEDVATKDALMQRVLSVRGEGLVLRKESAPWSLGSKEARTMLKVKPWHEAEAVVLGHNIHVSSLHCQAINQHNADGRAADPQPKFDLTWGRKGALAPPGSVVSYRYREVSLKRDMPMRQGLVKVHDASCSCRACEHVHAAVGGQGAQGDGSLL